VTPADSSALDEDGGVALSAHSRAQLMQSLQQRKSVIDTYLPQVNSLVYAPYPYCAWALLLNTIVFLAGAATACRAPRPS